MEQMQELANIITRKIVNHHDHEDATQEVLLGMAIAEQKANKEKGGLKAYMYKTGLGYFQKWCADHFAYKSFFRVSLDKELSEDGDLTYLDVLSGVRFDSPIKTLIAADVKATVRGAVRELNKKQAHVIRGRHLNKRRKTLRTLAHELDRSFERVRQLENEGLEKLRAKKRLAALA